LSATRPEPSGRKQYLLLLRGINLGPHKRIAMPALRELLASAGYGRVRTYVQSGNAVLSSDASPGELRDETEQLIAERFGFDVDVLVRTREELAEVVARDPLGDVAVNPKRYQVTFMASELPDEAAARLESLRVEPERLVIAGRELYTWHPDGVARSKLWTRTAGKDLGVVATARNWTTVTTLLAMADEA
jgi:uncharacterized protein (DUF1697 family)